MSNLKWLDVADGAIGVVGAVVIIMVMVPLHESGWFYLDLLAGVVLAAVAAAGLVVGVASGLLLRLPNPEAGMALGALLAGVVSIPVYVAIMFAHGRWWPGEEPIPMENLVMALASWSAYIVCLIGGTLLAAPRRHSRSSD